MEEELVVELCVRGYCVYEDILEPAIGEELPCEWGTRNRCSYEKRRHGGRTSTKKCVLQISCMKIFAVPLQPWILWKFLHCKFNYGYSIRHQIWIHPYIFLLQFYTRWCLSLRCTQLYTRLLMNNTCQQTSINPTMNCIHKLGTWKPCRAWPLLLIGEDTKW